MSKVTLAPLIPLVVQTLGVVDTKLTPRPDEDVALTLNGDWATVLFAKFAKVMVWAALLTVKLRLTGIAA